MQQQVGTAEGLPTGSGRVTEQHWGRGLHQILAGTVSHRPSFPPAGCPFHLPCWGLLTILQVPLTTQDGSCVQWVPLKGCRGQTSGSLFRTI